MKRLRCHSPAGLAVVLFILNNGSDMRFAEQSRYSRHSPMGDKVLLVRYPPVVICTIISVHSRLRTLDAVNTARYPISLEHYRMERNIAGRGKCATLLSMYGMSRNVTEFHFNERSLKETIINYSRYHPMISTIILFIYLTLLLKSVIFVRL